MAKKSAKAQKETLFKETLVPAAPGSDRLFEVSYDDSKPVECLGMTFPSDEARRAYFLARLREKLQDPEFRKIKGFPIAEDDDIIAMSDPPYYTACPNPFINDFIEIHGTEYDSKGKYHREPFTSDVSEGKTHPIYTAHAYHTKVPHRAIMRYILHYTKPGDVVFDGFCGTGMTGVAAQLCGDRNEVQSLGYRIDAKGKILEDASDQSGKTKTAEISELGERRVILNDLAPAATFIASNYALPINVREFKSEAVRILREVENELGWMYETQHSEGNTKGKVNYTVWSEVLACECGEEIIFTNEALDAETGFVREMFPCPRCGVETDKSSLTLLYESQFDVALRGPNALPKRVPVLINYQVRNGKYEKAPDDNDLDILQRISALPFPSQVPLLELPEMQMKRVGRMQPCQITHIHHFFLKRAAHTLNALWLKAATLRDRRVRNMLIFFVEQAISGLSVLNRYQPVMHGRLGGSQVNRAMSGVFYVASHISECSPKYNLENKLKRLEKAFTTYRTQLNTTLITTQDLSSVSIRDNSIDYIFTDPPFGENIYYSDLNILVESWHRVRTNSENEVIVDRVKEKTLLDYQRMMSDCFSNYYRILKPGRWMTVEFHNSKNSVWNAIQEALQHAGFVVADVRTLDKKQGSFQQVVSGNTVKRDLIISAYKPNGGLEEKIRTHAGSDQGAWEFTTTHLRQLPIFVSKAGKAEQISERQGYLLYDRMVAFHVQRGFPVPMSSPEFHAGIRQRFAERDGMYFLSDQVAEYDRKRMEVGAVEQLELFVSDEKSAIQWVRQQLGKQPLSYKELQPIYMREAQRVWDKHEQPLELKTILEQNFIQDKDETWRAADSKKEADLEQQRRRQLLKEFQEYQSTKGKLKIVRMEALRAGFTDAWQKKDYATIVQTAKRVPEAVIQEDQALLMYFDNASLLLGD
jgi:DNA modification methylase